MKRIAVFIFICVPFAISSQWTQCYYPSNLDMSNFMFINNTTGYFGGLSNVGYVWRTYDATNSYIMTSVAANSTFFDTYFFNSTTGFLCGNTGNNGVIYKTSDSLMTWGLKGTLPGKVYAMAFASKDTGYAVGDLNGFYLKTTNSGESWNVKPIQGRNVLKGVAFINNLTGWICGNECTIWKTTDGGSSWISQSLPIKTNLEKLKFSSANTGYIVGWYGIILKTTNSGVNWLPLGTAINNYLYDISLVDTSRIYVCGTNRLIMMSTNSGLSWQQQITPNVLCTITNIQMIDKDNGFAAGNQLQLWRTTNGGISAIEQNGTEAAEHFSLKQNYPNPFNPSTIIHYSIMKSTHVKLIVLDLLGKVIRVLVDETQNAGSYENTFDGPGLSSGIYLYQIETTEFSDIKKMVLIK